MEQRLCLKSAKYMIRSIFLVHGRVRRTILCIAISQLFQSSETPETKISPCWKPVALHFRFSGNVKRWILQPAYWIWKRKLTAANVFLFFQVFSDETNHLILTCSNKIENQENFWVKYLRSCICVFFFTSCKMSFYSIETKVQFP